MGHCLHWFGRLLYPMFRTYYSLISTCTIHLPRITLTTRRGLNPPYLPLYYALCRQSIQRTHCLPLRVREDKLCRAVERAIQICRLTCDPSVLIGRDSSFCMRAPGKSRTAPRVWQTNFRRGHAYFAASFCVDGRSEMAGEGCR